MTHLPPGPLTPGPYRSQTETRAAEAGRAVRLYHGPCWLRSRLAWTVVAVAVTAVAPAAQPNAAEASLAETLARVGARVEQWYSRAQNIVSLETVWIQRLRSDWSSADMPRHLEYELRVAWDPDGTVPGSLPEASVLRQVVAVNGRPPRDTDEPGCMDPKPVSPEPLAMLLAPQREDFEFSHAGETRVRGRSAVMIDYRGMAHSPAGVRWRDDCVSVSLPGRSTGRIWIDAATYDVLRLDEHLVGQFEFPVPREQVRQGAATSMLIEHAESSIEFRRVEFQDPAEVLVLPAAIDTLTVVRGRGVQRTRITQRFSDFRRFLADGRIVR